MVQDQVQLDGPFGPAELCPVKHAHGQVEQGGVQAEQFVFKPKILSKAVSFSATLQHQEEHPLIEFPGAMFIGIGQVRALGGCHTPMGELPLAGCAGEDLASISGGSHQAVVFASGDARRNEIPPRNPMRLN